MNPELQKLVEKLVEYAATPEKQQEVVSALQTKAHQQIFQPISNIGFNAGRKKSEDEDLSPLQSEVTRLKGQLQTLKTEHKALLEKTPELSKLQEESAAAVAKLEERNKADRAEARAKMQKAFADRDLADFEGKLVAQGVHPEFAKAQAILLKDRMKYDDAGKLTVMQKGNEQLPVSVTDGHSLLEVVAGEIVAATPTELLRATAVPGGGQRGASSGAGKGNEWDAIRESTRAAEAARAPRTDIAAGFLGLATPPQHSQGNGSNGSATGSRPLPSQTTPGLIIPAR